MLVASVVMDSHRHPDDGLAGGDSLLALAQLEITDQMNDMGSVGCSPEIGELAGKVHVLQTDSGGKERLVDGVVERDERLTTCRANPHGRHRQRYCTPRPLHTGLQDSTANRATRGKSVIATGTSRGVVVLSIAVPDCTFGVALVTPSPSQRIPPAPRRPGDSLGDYRWEGGSVNSGGRRGPLAVSAEVSENADQIGLVNDKPFVLLVAPSVVALWLRRPSRF